MTEAQKKAKKLVDRFLETDRMCDCYCEHSPNDCDCSIKKTELESAKQCALICVDEQKKSLRKGKIVNRDINELEFLEKVKQEINKL